jgi:hypothetical protein
MISALRLGRGLLCVIGMYHLLGGLPQALAQDAAKAPPKTAADTTKAAAADTVRSQPTSSTPCGADRALPRSAPAQTLVASTYPLEIVQLQQWLAKHPSLKDQALADSVAKQPWDVSIKSMTPVPEVVKRLADDVQWTTELGNAFLAQQDDVMDAVQRMRQKAKGKGTLESNEHQTVETTVVESKHDRHRVHES